MSSRKGHNKSRHGCLRCKERRVKCSEIGPCNNCIRRREDCSLADPSFNDSPSTRSSPGSISTTEPSTFFLTQLLFHSHIPERLPLLSSEWSQDLYLMSHFVLSTCTTITSRPAIIYMWQHVVPKDAVSHSFLMHGLLAFSALHLASLHHQDAALRYHYAQLCEHHQAKAIPEFRRALLNLKPESAGPCFAMGSILACLAVAAVSDNRLDLALDNSIPSEGGTNISSQAVSLDTLLSIFTLIRGIRSILEPSWAWESFSSSPYGVAAHGHGSLDFDALQLPHHISRVYTKWRQVIEDIPESELSETEKFACLAALHKREHVEKDVVFHREKTKSQQHTTTDEMVQNNIEQSFLFRWVAEVPDQFVGLLVARNRTAMEILRGFIALLEPLKDAWYLRGFMGNSYRALDDMGPNV